MLLNIIKRLIESKIIDKQGGNKTSELARKKAEKRRVLIGMYTYGSCFNDDFNTGGEVRIGKYSSFGPNVHYFGADHPINHASMSPYFYNKSWGFEVVDVNRNKLSIGNDCWIGNNVTIVSSCSSIGNGSVIAAGAVVTKDVPPYSIVAGVPARIIKYRFDDDTILMLEASRWWDLSPDELMQFYHLIEMPKEWADCISKYKSSNNK